MATVHLILFTRAPVPGQTKTRLAAALGADAAKDLHVCCLRDLIETCERFKDEWETIPEAAEEVQLHLFITPPDSASIFAREGLSWGDHVLVHGQTGDSLAGRMANAFAEVLREAPAQTRVLLIGADIPLLDGRHLRQALAALENADVVFGGTEDGGYYLVGTRGPVPKLFQLKRWKEGQVLGDSLALGEAQGFSTALIDTLPDVDTGEDLRLVRAHPLFRELTGRRAVQFIAKLVQ